MAIVTIVDGRGGENEPAVPRQQGQRLMVVAIMASLPPPPTTTTATLALVPLALALALPQTKIGWWGGGCITMCLILHCRGCCCWCHLCLHSQDHGTKDDGRGNRIGRHANIRGWEEVGHHNPINVEQQKLKLKLKLKLKQQLWRQRQHLCACK